MFCKALFDPIAETLQRTFSGRMLHKAYKCLQLCSQTSFRSPSFLSSRCRPRQNLERASDSLMSCFEDLLAWPLPPSPPRKTKRRARWPRRHAGQRRKSRRSRLRLTRLQQVNLKLQMSQRIEKHKPLGSRFLDLGLCTFEAVNRKSTILAIFWLICWMLIVTKLVVVVRTKSWCAFRKPWGSWQACLKDKPRRKTCSYTCHGKSWQRPMAQADKKKSKRPKPTFLCTLFPNALLFIAGLEDEKQKRNQLFAKAERKP